MIDLKMLGWSPNRRSCIVLLRTKSRRNVSMLKSRSIPISPDRCIVSSASIALFILAIIVDGFIIYLKKWGAFRLPVG